MTTAIISLCPKFFFFQLVLMKMSEKRHQFPSLPVFLSPFPHFSGAILASLLLFQPDKLDPFPEYLHLFIHLLVTCSPQMGDSWFQSHPTFFLDLCSNATSSERPSLSNPKAVYKMPPIHHSLFSLCFFFPVASITLNIFCVYWCIWIHRHTNNLFTAYLSC